MGLRFVPYACQLLPHAVQLSGKHFSSVGTQVGTLRALNGWRRGRSVAAVALRVLPVKSRVPSAGFRLRGQPIRFLRSRFSCRASGFSSRRTPLRSCENALLLSGRWRVPAVRASVRAGASRVLAVCARSSRARANACGTVSIASIWIQFRRQKFSASGMHFSSPLPRSSWCRAAFRSCGGVPLPPRGCQSS